MSYGLFLKIKQEDFAHYKNRNWVRLIATEPTHAGFAQPMVTDVGDPKYQKLSHEYTENDRIQETIGELAELIRLSEQHSFTVTLFINPIHHFTYLHHNLPLFMQFKKALAELTDYYDFSGLNSITTDNNQYFETSHYGPYVGDLIIARVFDTGEPVPEDFGHLVTGENFSSHSEMLRRQLREAAEEIPPACLVPLPSASPKN